MITIHVFSAPKPIDASKILYEKDMIFNRLTPKCMVNYIYFLRQHHSYSWEKLLKVFPEYLSTNKKI